MNLVWCLFGSSKWLVQADHQMVTVTMKTTTIDAGLSQPQNIFLYFSELNKKFLVGEKIWICFFDPREDTTTLFASRL